MLQKEFQSVWWKILNQHFYSSWLLRLSSSALEKCLIILLECNRPGLQCQKKNKKNLETFKLEPVHWNWCLFTHPHQTWAKSYHTSLCIFAGVGTSIYYFTNFNYLQSATTCEKSLKPNKTVVSIRMHHIYSLSLQDENNVTLFSLIPLSSVPTRLKCGSCCCFHLESCGP